MQRATGSFVVPSLDEEDKCPSCLPNRELLQVLLYTRFCLRRGVPDFEFSNDCLLYTSDAADERSSVDLGGRRIIKKQKQVSQQ